MKAVIPALPEIAERDDFSVPGWDRRDRTRVIGFGDAPRRGLGKGGRRVGIREAHEAASVEIHVIGRNGDVWEQQSFESAGRLYRVRVVKRGVHTMDVARR